MCELMRFTFDSRRRGMAAPILIARTDVTAADLRAAAAATDDANAARRLLAVAMIIDGNLRETAATACAMDRQTLCDWVHRFNEEGIDGLSDRPRTGRPSRTQPRADGGAGGWWTRLPI